MTMVIKKDVKKAMELHRVYLSKSSKEPIHEDELRHKRSLIPQDIRDFTGKAMGDPIPGDKRRFKCKSEGSVIFAGKRN